jgi:hypothetical protein
MPAPLARCAFSSKSSGISTVIFRAVAMIFSIPYSIPVFNMVFRARPQPASVNFDSAINFAAVADLENQNFSRAILNVADRAQIADPITPQSAECAGQGLANGARVFVFRYALIHVIKDALCGRLIQFLQLVPGGLGVINRRNQSPKPRSLLTWALE